MAVLTGATSSGRQFCQTMPSVTTTVTTNYSAPAQSPNVTSPSATAYIKEIIITAVQAVSVQIYLVPSAGASGNSNTILFAQFSEADTKILSGINIMMPAGSTLYVNVTVANAATITISGVEVQ